VGKLRAAGELCEINVQVDPILEISEIYNRVVKRSGPALLFHRVKGHDFPVLINAFGTRRRMELALERESLDAIGEEVALLLKPELPTSLLEKLRALPRLRRLSELPPRLVSTGACQEVVETAQPSLAPLPLIQCWPQDGGGVGKGRYITLGLTFTKHPEHGTRNVGLYRLQKFDDKTLGMHWQQHKGAAHHYRVAEERGERLEVAIVIGGDPATIYAASAPLPDEVDELLLAGFLRGEPVNLVKCKTIDMEVPANAEIVLEGYCEPGERRLEGPFGDHQGYYSQPDEYPVFHLTAVTRRRNPIYITTVVGPPPQEDAWLGKATERIFLPLIRATVPEIVDINLPIEGIFHNLAIVSIDKRYPGHARKVMHALWGLGQLMFTKTIVVVDKDVNVQDLGEVIWKVGTHFDPKYDVVLSEGVCDDLDFAAYTPGISGKLGIDATRKLPQEGFSRPWPEECRMSEEIKQRVDALWDQLGL